MPPRVNIVLKGPGKGPRRPAKGGGKGKLRGARPNRMAVRSLGFFGMFTGAMPCFVPIIERCCGLQPMSELGECSLDSDVGSMPDDEPTAEISATSLLECGWESAHVANAERPAGAYPSMARHTPCATSAARSPSPALPGTSTLPRVCGATA